MKRWRKHPHVNRVTYGSLCGGRLIMLSCGEGAVDLFGFVLGDFRSQPPSVEFGQLAAPNGDVDA